MSVNVGLYVNIKMLYISFVTCDNIIQCYLLAASDINDINILINQTLGDINILIYQILLIY